MAFENTVLALFYCGCNQFKSFHICFSAAKVAKKWNTQKTATNYFLI